MAMHSLRKLAFQLGALAMIGAAVYHCAALALPAFGKVAYPLDYPVWRHILFVAITVTFAGLLIWRPIWLIWPYIVLAVQQINGHGRWAWMLWHQGKPVTWVFWVQIVEIVGLLLGFWLLFVDWRERRLALTAAPGAE